MGQYRIGIPGQKSILHVHLAPIRVQAKLLCVRPQQAEGQQTDRPDLRQQLRRDRFSQQLFEGWSEGRNALGPLEVSFSSSYCQVR